MRRGMRLRRFRRRIDFSGGESRGARVRSDRMGCGRGLIHVPRRRKGATRHDTTGGSSSLAGKLRQAHHRPPQNLPLPLYHFSPPPTTIDRLDPNSKIRLHISFNLFDELVQSTFEITVELKFLL
ncbi:hypothetical protein LSTR_LSTR015988 [Laodelphax striatellus]|uniref:Uncharacterized protein n=1 Tax=Laodelphax striatellus TaxID=195883 RepID=A0A482XSA3_LAOST|nr:hypothetical protein LSTR_LSTR015988 [Laodelphax striatellus]